MATLTVWKFETDDGATQAESILQGLAKQELITLRDAAIVSWPIDTKRPKTRQLADMGKAGALGGAFWGLLFGVLFFVPLLGMAVGAATGALVGGLADVGIDDDFIDTVRKRIEPGTSALFLLSSDAVLDKVHDALADTHPELIQSNLSTEAEQQLREVFGDA